MSRSFRWNEWNLDHATKHGVVVEEIELVVRRGRRQYVGNCKYRVAGRAQTQTTAGQVQGESFIYVDKETGLPLRIEGFGQTTGNVQGVSGGNLVAEMRDIKTEANLADFELPQGFSKVTPEEVKQMTAQLTSAMQFIMNLLNQQQQGGANPPTVVASPTASPR